MTGTTYQYAFDRVEDYLHHRPPYLMVERIVSIEPSEIVTEKTFRGDEFFVPGHFPGAPIMPGAMMQELTTQSAGVLIAAKHNPNHEFDTSDPYFNEFALGVLVKVTTARYRNFARPGQTLRTRITLTEHVSNIFDFRGEITVDENVINAKWLSADEHQVECATRKVAGENSVDLATSCHHPVSTRSAIRCTAMN